jgi:Uma2 family endonuclease
MEFKSDFISSYSSEPRSEAEIQYELERGKPMPSVNHSLAQIRLAVSLDKNYSENFQVYPELEIAFPIKNCIPNLSIYPIEKTNWLKDSIRRKDIPLLVIEILSSRQAFDEIVEKVNDIYFPAGLKSAWVVLPSAQSIMLFKPNEKPQTYNDGILKDEASGFSVDLSSIFK